MNQDNAYAEAARLIKRSDAIILTAGNSFSIAEGVNIFANDQNYRRYFARFRQKYGPDCLLRGVFTRCAKQIRKNTYVSFASISLRIIMAAPSRRI